MGLFKGMKDLKDVTKQAKQLQEQQQAEQGFKPGMAGQFQQMGSMLDQTKQQLAELNDSQGDRGRLMAEGISGQGVIVGMGTPERGAQWFNLDIDLEVHVSGRAAYRVANQYLVPQSAQIGPGVTLPIKVDPDDQSKIAIDWDSVGAGPARGEVRPSAGGASPEPAAPTPASAAPADSGDQVAQLERLAKLHEQGTLTDAEFEQQKAKVLSSS